MADQPLGPLCGSRVGLDWIDDGTTESCRHSPPGISGLNAHSGTSALDLQARSGAHWCAKFPGSDKLESCGEPFRKGLTQFVAALRKAGAQVTIANTFRPRERAYMMHWCWRITRENVDPRSIPAMAGIAINWCHRNSARDYQSHSSRTAAMAMVARFGLQNLKVQPALDSRHSIGMAVDMSISWRGNLNISNDIDQIVSITTLPRNGMNSVLKDVGVGYGVIKFVGGYKDVPHWSDDGS